MALTQVTASNGWVYVKGVVTPDTPQPLGPVGRVFALADTSKLGTHHGALYTVTPSTGILRLFFDHAKKARNDIGYIQFCQLYSCGQAIPPGTIPALAGRRFYCSDDTKGIYLEFMGPKDANVRLKGGPCETPFYPLNATLLRQFTRFADYEAFCWHPMPNGSIRRGDDLYLNPQTKPHSTALPSQVASLVLPISPFMLTEAAIAAHCTTENVLIDETLAASAVDGFPLFEVVKAALIEGDTDPAPVIKDVQAVGTFLVLTQDDGEDGAGGTTYVARRDLVPNDSTKRRIIVWEIDRDTFASLEHNATLDTLDRVAAFLTKAKVRPDKFTVPARVRGWSGLRPPPDVVYWNKGPLLQMKMLSVIFARAARTGVIVPCAGVASEVKWEYDVVAESLELTAAQPVPVGTVDLAAIAKSLGLYKTTLDSPPSDDAFNLASFTVAGSPWFDGAKPYPVEPTSSPRFPVRFGWPGFAPASKAGPSSTFPPPPPRRVCPRGSPSPIRPHRICSARAAIRRASVKRAGISARPMDSSPATARSRAARSRSSSVSRRPRPPRRLRPRAGRTSCLRRRR